MRSWTTTDLPAREQYGYWREVICQAFTVLDPIPHARDSFESTAIASDITDLTVTRVSSRAQTVVRGAREIRRQLSEEFYVMLQLSGACRVHQRKRETLVAPGDFVMIDAAEPYRLDFEDWDILCFTVPHRRLQPLLHSAQDALALRCGTSGGLASIIRAYMQSLGTVSENLPEAAQGVVASQLLQLLALSFRPDISRDTAQDRESLRSGLKYAIDRHLDSNLVSSDLSVSAVAGRFHLSPRSLHRLYEESGTSFAQSVLNRRLDRAASLLGDPSCTLAVSEIAYRAGFNDLSHFCKTFRRRFGLPAGEFRQASRRRNN